MPGVTKASLIEFINIPDQFGFTALHLAAFNGDLVKLSFFSCNQKHFVKWYCCLKGINRIPEKQGS